MDKKTTELVGYLFIVGWVIAYLTGDKEGAKFHLNQALLTHICIITAGVIGAVFGIIPFLGTAIGTILSMCAWIVWLIGFIYAVQDVKKEIPIIGSIRILN